MGSRLLTQLMYSMEKYNEHFMDSMKIYGQNVYGSGQNVYDMLDDMHDDTLDQHLLHEEGPEHQLLEL